MTEKKQEGCPYLDDHEMEKLAEKAAEKAVQKMTDHVYRSIGKNVLEKIFYMIGVITLAAIIYLQSKGYFVDG